MIVNQTKDFLNSLTAQAYGESAITVSDQTGLISLGKTVLSSDTSVDTFFKTLVDRIYYTIVGARRYKRKFGDFIMHTSDYGCVLQKIRTKLAKAETSPQYNLTAGQSVPQYDVVIPQIVQKLFEGRNVWQIPVTVPEQGLQTAFTSYEAMSAFIDSIFTMVQNSLEGQLEADARAAMTSFIGEKLYSSTQNTSGIEVVYPVQLYNETFGKTLTAKQATYDLDYLKFTSRLINLYIKRLTDMSNLFNGEDMTNFTPESDLRVTMLADFTTAAQYYLQSDTFHDELVALPHYTEVNFWQGNTSATSKYAFEDTSTIDIITTDGHSVKQDGVICVLSDVEAIGMMCDRQRMRTSPVNGNGEYINYFQKAETRYYNDLSENGIIFVQTDTPFAVETESSSKVAAKLAKK